MFVMSCRVPLISEEIAGKQQAFEQEESVDIFLTQNKRSTSDKDKYTITANTTDGRSFKQLFHNVEIDSNILLQKVQDQDLQAFINKSKQLELKIDNISICLHQQGNAPKNIARKISTEDLRDQDLDQKAKANMLERRSTIAISSQNENSPYIRRSVDQIRSNENMLEKLKDYENKLKTIQSQINLAENENNSYLHKIQNYELQIQNLTQESQFLQNNQENLNQEQMMKNQDMKQLNQNIDLIPVQELQMQQEVEDRQSVEENSNRQNEQKQKKNIEKIKIIMLELVQQNTILELHSQVELIKLQNTHWLLTKSKQVKQQIRNSIQSLVTIFKETIIRMQETLQIGDNQYEFDSISIANKIELARTMAIISTSRSSQISVEDVIKIRDILITNWKLKQNVQLKLTEISLNQEDKQVQQLVDKYGFESFQISQVLVSYFTVLVSLLAYILPLIQSFIKFIQNQTPDLRNSTNSKNYKQKFITSDLILQLIQRTFQAELLNYILSMLFS